MKALFSPNGLPTSKDNESLRQVSKRKPDVLQERVINGLTDSSAFGLEVTSSPGSRSAELEVCHLYTKRLLPGVTARRIKDLRDKRVVEFGVCNFDIVAQYVACVVQHQQPVNTGD